MIPETMLADGFVRTVPINIGFLHASNLRIKAKLEQRVRNDGTLATLSQLSQVITRPTNLILVLRLKRFIFAGLSISHLNTQYSILLPIFAVCVSIS